MHSTTRTLRGAVAGAIVLALLLGACSSDAGSSGTTTTATAVDPDDGIARNADGTPVKAPSLPRATPDPARHLGPQGQVGQFVARCMYSHSGPADPIVHAGMAGRSHLHDFYGFTGTDESTTGPDMVGAETTCDKKADSAAYWHPTLYRGDERIEPLDLRAYYRAAPGVEPSEVQTMPVGLALIAGDQYASEPQPGEATGWTCGTRTDVSDDPPTCAASAPLHLVLTFQDCWDGRHLDSQDHQSHVAYSADGECPETHPVHIPQLTMSVRFPVWDEADDLRLSSGNIYSAHGDFFNGWVPEGLEREIRSCIHRDVVCNLGSNRDEENLFSG
jgi:hypothetical protein